MSIAGGKQSKTTPAPSGCRHLQGFSGEAEDPWTFEVFWVGRDIPGGCGAALTQPRRANPMERGGVALC